MYYRMQPHRKAKDYGIVRSAAISRETRFRQKDVGNSTRERYQNCQDEDREQRNAEPPLSSVTDNDGSMAITAIAEKPTFHARTPVNNARDRGSNRKQWTKPTWEELGGDYLHFTFFKENKDTMECIRRIFCPCREAQQNCTSCTVSRWNTGTSSTPLVLRNASPIDKRRHNMPPNEAIGQSRTPPRMLNLGEFQHNPDVSGSGASNRVKGWKD